VTASRLNIALLRPLWLRASILVAIALPPLLDSSFSRETVLADPFNGIAKWAAYCVFVWVLISLNIGLDRLLSWLAGATLLALTVAFTGKLFRTLAVWEALERLLKKLGLAASSGPQNYDAEMVWKFLLIMVALPYALFVLNCFSAAGALERASRLGTRGKGMGVHVALFLRVLQHSFEVSLSALGAWREENPGLIVPRLRQDWRHSLLSRFGWFGWFKDALLTWAFALLVLTLTVVPVFVDDTHQVRDWR